MAKKTAAKKSTTDDEIMRVLAIEKLGKTQTWKLTRKAIKGLGAPDARDFEAGFAARAQDFNQGKSGGEREVPSQTQAWWNGYQFALEQEP